MAAPPPPPPAPAVNAAPAPPANPLGYRPKTQAFITTQARAGFAHDLYRRTGTTNIDQNDPAQNAAFQAWTQPVAGAPPFQLAPPGSAAARRQLAAAIANRTRRRPGALHGGLQVGTGQWTFSTGPSTYVAQAAERITATDLLNHFQTRARMASIGLSFVKQLDWDENGTTVLWHWTNAAGGAGNVVSKVRLRGIFLTPAYANALDKSDRFARTPHLVHRAPLRDHIAPLASPLQVAQAANLEFNVDFIWMEFARHGNLGRWIARVLREAKEFPRSVLWRLFECLIEACVAMLYPPRLQNNPAHPIHGPDLPEIIPANFLMGWDNIVHMSLSPPNIYIEDYHVNTHPNVPRLQVGDFEYSCDPGQLGLPNFMAGPHPFQRLTRLWSNRVSGKQAWYLPEHFSAEWDHVNYEPYSEGLTNWATGVGAAGAFDEKSNIFHAAMNIWCCMLLHQPEVPPRATPVPRSGANMGNQGWTYTGEMRFREYHAKFGRHLCDLVSECCKHMPADRPDLAQVRARIAQGVASNPVSADDMRFLTSTLHEPGNPPPVPQPGTLPPGALFRLPF